MSDEMTLRNINEMKRLMANVRGDITATGQRAKNMEEFVESIGVYTNVNPLTSTKHLDQTNKVVQGITESFDAGYKGQGIGGHRSVYREISQKYTMGYVTRMGDDMKDQLRGILAKNLDKGLGWQETARDMTKNVDGMTRKRAVMIARTESVRAKNLGQWAEHKEMGYKYFEVLPHSTACKRCKKAYIGVVFPMTGKFTVMLPPLHPNCRCAARFYKSVPAGYRVVRQVPKEFRPSPKPKPQPKPKPEPHPSPGSTETWRSPYKDAFHDTGIPLNKSDEYWAKSKNLKEFTDSLRNVDNAQIHALLTTAGKPAYITKSPPSKFDYRQVAEWGIKNKAPIEIHNIHQGVSPASDISNALYKWGWETRLKKGMSASEMKKGQKMLLVNKNSTFEMTPRSHTQIQRYKYRADCKGNPTDTALDIMEKIGVKQSEIKTYIDSLPTKTRATFLKKFKTKEDLDDYIFTKSMQSYEKEMGVYFRRYDTDTPVEDIIKGVVKAKTLPRLPAMPKGAKGSVDRSWFPINWSPERMTVAVKEYKTYPKDLRVAAEKNKMSVYEDTRNIPKYGNDDCWIFKDIQSNTEVVIPKSFYQTDEIGGTLTHRHDLTEILKWYKESDISTRKSTTRVFLTRTKDPEALAYANPSGRYVEVHMKWDQMWSRKPGADKSFKQVIKHEMGHCLDFVVSRRELDLGFFGKKGWSSEESGLYFKAMKRDDALLKKKYKSGEFNWILKTKWGRQLNLRARDRRERYVTSYGESAARQGWGLTEDFAESVSFRQLYPEEFAKFFPNRAKVLDELFNAYG